MCNTWISRLTINFEMMHCVLYICQLFPIYKIAFDHQMSIDVALNVKTQCSQETHNSFPINTFDVSTHKISLMSYVMQQLNNEMHFFFLTSNKAVHVWSCY